MTKTNNKLISISKASEMLGVSINTLRRWDKSGKLVAIRLSSTGNRYYNKSDIEILLNNPLAIARGWVSGAEPGLLSADYYCKTRDIFQGRLENLQNRLAQSISEETSALVTAIAGEIGNNSFDHNLGNWPDVTGIFFSQVSGRKIVLADRGQGVLATLKNVKPDLETHAEALSVAFTQRISARSLEARGNGLKFVKSVVTSHSFKLEFKTGNAVLTLSKEETDVNVREMQESIQGTYAVIEY